MKLLVMVIATVFAIACSSSANPIKTDQQIAKEAIECMLENGKSLEILLLGGKTNAAHTLVETSTREQLIVFRNDECS